MFPGKAISVCTAVCRPGWQPRQPVSGLVYFGYYRPNFTAYGTVRMQINPDVEMTISKTEKVLDLEGLNEDGRNLVSDYE